MDPKRTVLRSNERYRDWISHRREMATRTPYPQNLEDKVVHAAIRIGLDWLPNKVSESLVQPFHAKVDTEYRINFNATIKPKFYPPTVTIEETQAAKRAGN